MMRISKSQRNNLIFLVLLLLLLIPQTRQPIQVFLQKGLALINPSVIKEADRKMLTDYQWQLVDENGSPYDFESAKGKVVFINFWATWCPPCIAEMPNLDRLYKDYKDEVVFLLVSNEAPETIKAFKEKHGYGFKVHSALGPEPELLQISTIPRTFVLDKKGGIVIDKSGAAHWDSKKVRKQLDQLINAE